jgi:hypothetical protein
MDVASVASAMLNAAKTAAGTTWDQIQHDFLADISSVIRNAARIEAKLAARQLSEDDARQLIEDQRGTLAMLVLEVQQDQQILVQNAVNAALNALWTAVRAALP